MGIIKTFLIGAKEMLTFKNIDSVYPRLINILLGITGWLMIMFNAYCFYKYYTS